VDVSSLPEEPLRPEALCFGTSSTELILNEDLADMMTHKMKEGGLKASKSETMLKSNVQSIIKEKQ